MCVATPPIDRPVTYVRLGRPYLRAKRSHSAAVSSAARPGISDVLLKLDAPQAIALADQVAADAGRRDLGRCGELPVPVHVEHEPPVPAVRHLDLVDAAAEAPEVGARARARLERRVVERHALGFRAHLNRWRQEAPRRWRAAAAETCISGPGRKSALSAST